MFQESLYVCCLKILSADEKGILYTSLDWYYVLFPLNIPIKWACYDFHNNLSSYGQIKNTDCVFVINSLLFCIVFVSKQLFY